MPRPAGREPAGALADNQLLADHALETGDTDAGRLTVETSPAGLRESGPDLLGRVADALWDRERRGGAAAFRLRRAHLPRGGPLLPRGGADAAEEDAQLRQQRLEVKLRSMTLRCEVAEAAARRGGHLLGERDAELADLRARLEAAGRRRGRSGRRRGHVGRARGGAAAGRRRRRRSPGGAPQPAQVTGGAAVRHASSLAVGFILARL